MGQGFSICMCPNRLGDCYTCRDLIKSDRTLVLMHRYNMAHGKTEEQVFPMAQQAGIPLVALTWTRWGNFMEMDRG